MVAVGLPVVYFGMFFHSVRQQAKQMGLVTPKDAYRVELEETGVRMLPAGQQDKAAQAASHTWDQVYGAWRTPGAIYLYVTAQQAYLLPEAQIPGGADRAWELLGSCLPAEKLHTARG